MQLRQLQQHKHQCQQHWYEQHLGELRQHLEELQRHLRPLQLRKLRDRQLCMKCGARRELLYLQRRL